MAGPWEKYSKPAENGPWAKYAEKPGTVSDMAQSAVSGIRRGIEAGIGGFGDVADLNARGASWLAGKLGAGEGFSEGLGDVVRRVSAPGLPTQMTTRDIQENVTNPTIGEAYEPQTTAGEYARTVGEFLPAAAIGQGSLPGRLLTQAVIPALGSETAGQLTKDTAAEPYARIIGALLGSAVPSLAKRAITPFPTSPERLRMADTLAGEGVDLTAGQRTGSDRLRYMESELGGMRGQQMMEQQGEQFTAAALRRAGIDAPRATPEVIDDAFTRIGQEFDGLAARTSTPFDQQLQNDLLGVVTDYQSTAATPAPVVERMMTRASELAGQNGNVLSGDAYQNLRSEIGRLSRASDGPTRGALRDLQGALDDAIGRAMPADLVDQWGNVRNQYRNMLTLERAATGAGENAAQGLVSPSQLRNSAVSTQGRRNYARGQGDFAELARAGEAVMKPLPNSGTASRTSARNLGASLSALAGGGVGSTMGPMGAIIGMLAGGALPAAAGRAMLSGPGRAYLSNQLLSGQGTASPEMRAILSALIGSGQARSQLTSQ